MQLPAESKKQRLSPSSRYHEHSLVTAVCLTSPFTGKSKLVPVLVVPRNVSCSADIVLLWQQLTCSSFAEPHVPMPNRVLNAAELCTSDWCSEAVQGNDHIVYLVCTSALPSHLLSSKGLWKLTCNHAQSRVPS